jgi:hypothetical protein
MPPPSPVEAAAANLAWLWYLYVILHSWAFMNSAKDHHIMIIWNRFQIVSWTKCRSSLSEVQKKTQEKRTKHKHCTVCTPKGASHVGQVGTGHLSILCTFIKPFKSVIFAWYMFDNMVTG